MRYSRPPLSFRIHLVCAGLTYFWFVSDYALSYFYWHTRVEFLHALDWHMLAALQNGVADYVMLFGVLALLTGPAAAWCCRKLLQQTIIWIICLLCILCICFQPSYGVA